eukprot:c21709_g2_i1.p1 GENE.c21709_g2_i1~~c21709_g2_i1.p1  ORF type:complete len:308 (+),score=63.83 c21709_g2_i1:28-924(+)
MLEQNVEVKKKKIAEDEIISDEIKVKLETFSCDCDCKNNFSSETLFVVCKTFFLMTEEARHSLVQFQLSANFCSHNSDKDANTNPVKKSRTSYSYYLQGKEICQSAYMAFHCVGAKMLRNIQASIRDGVVIPLDSKRGLANFSHGHYRSFLAKIFIHNFSLLHGQYNPTGRGAHGNNAAIYLPPHLSKKVVYETYYLSAAKECEYFHDPLKEKGFFDLWNKFFPFVHVKKSVTDFCEICWGFDQATNAEEKELHIKESNEERKHYLSNIQTCQQNALVYSHISFDFAEKVCYFFFLNC